VSFKKESAVPEEISSVKAAELQSNHEIPKYHLVYSKGLYFCEQTNFMGMHAVLSWVVWQTTHDNAAHKQLTNSTAHTLPSWLKVMVVKNDSRYSITSFYHAK